ncbi:MAG: hypothetical protein NT062_37540 [Proteobacteria bacterium]|nr:hypothetical protein [Pseudomonadota bacterium]
MLAPKIAVAVALLAGCGPQLQSIRLVNRTDRAIEELYIYPTGAANHGASRGTIAPNATTQLSIPRGRIEVLAVSAKVAIDPHVTERRTASSAIELGRPIEVVFYDEANRPAGLERADVIGVSFVPDKTAPAPADPSDPPTP